MTGKALLVAAGIGSRLAPLTDVLPKCLMPIGGQPLLGLWRAMLRQAGIADIVVNLHHHAELVRSYIARSPYAPLVTAAYESRLLGTGGTLLHHRDRFRDGPVLFAHADNLTSFSVPDFFARHAARPPGACITMMTFVTDAPEQCGIVELDSQGLVTAMHEKSPNPPGRLANAAVYIVDPEIADFMAGLGRDVIDFSTEVLPHFWGRVFSFHNDIYHRDIGTPVSLARAQFQFPLVADPALLQGEGDPWFGLMRENGGRLAEAFGHAVDSAYRQAGARKDG